MGGIEFSQEGVGGLGQGGEERGGGKKMADRPGSRVSSLGWDAGNPALSFPRCFLEIRETLSCSNPSYILP